MAGNPDRWGAPSKAYSVNQSGVKLPPIALVHPDGRSYLVSVATLCGDDDATIELVPMEPQPAWKLARRAQLAASIQHVQRRGCRKCQQLLKTTLSPAERRFLYTQEPTPGAVQGLAGGAEGLGV